MIVNQTFYDSDTMLFANLYVEREIKLSMLTKSFKIRNRHHCMFYVIEILLSTIWNFYIKKLLNKNFYW